MQANRKPNIGTRRYTPEAVAVFNPDARAIDETVLLLCQGKIRRGTVDTKLPFPLAGNRFFAPAPVVPHSDTKLEAVQEMVTTCAPWVRVFVGPRLWSVTDAESSDLSDSRSFLPLSVGGLAYEIGGVAYGRPYMTDGKPEIIGLSFWRSQSDALKTLRHELWHVLEYHLRPDDLAAVDAMAEGGRHYPTWYMHSPVERRARLFEAWATARAEGWIAPHLHGTCLTHVDRVFHYVLSGGLALDVMSGRLPRSQDVPFGKVFRKLRAAYDEVGWQGIMAASLAMFVAYHSYRF